jgi:hypothetical protein
MNKFLLLIALCTLQSCFIFKKKNVIEDASIPDAIINEAPIQQKDLKKLYKQREKIIEGLQKQSEEPIETYASRLKINTNTNGKSLGISALLRIASDSLIWSSISVIGAIEVARAQVDKDTIRVMNRINSEYIVRPFDFIYDYLGRDVNFSMVQSILMGTVVKEFLNPDLDIAYLNAASTEEIGLKGDNESYNYTIKLDAQSNVTGYIIKSKSINQNLEVSYTAFEKIGGRSYPSKAEIKTNQGNDTFVADIEYSKIEINQALNFPFTVPDKYELK